MKRQWTRDELADHWTLGPKELELLANKSVLFHIAEASVDQPDGRVCDVVFPAAGGEQKLRDLVREYKSSGPAFRLQVHTYLRAWCRNCSRRLSSARTTPPTGR
jgi:hypothetical protein